MGREGRAAAKAEGWCAMNEKKRERGEGRIFVRGQIAWIQFQDARHKQVRESTEISIEEPNWKKHDAKKLRKALGEVAAGIRPDSCQITYENLREAFYADCEVNEHKSLRHDKRGRPHLDKVARLDRFFSGTRATDVDAGLIRKFIQEERDRGLSNATINRSVSALRRMFNLAREDGKLRQIPCFPMVKESAPHQGFFEREEYEALAAALPGYLRLPFSLGYYTGMREGEILSLKWSQVDFLAGTIGLRARETKNDEARTVPIVPELRALLVEQRAKHQSDCGYVCFRLDAKGRAVKIGSFRKVWQSRCVKLGLGKMERAVDRITGEALYTRPRGPRSKPKAKMVYHGKLFHDLRRTGVRNMIRANVPQSVAMKISGHKTDSVFRRYDITSANDVIDAGRKLEAFHRGQVGDNSGTELHQNAAAGSVVH